MSEYPGILMNGKRFWIMQSHIVCVLAQIAVKLVSLQQQQIQKQRVQLHFWSCFRGWVRCRTPSAAAGVKM